MGGLFVFLWLRGAGLQSRAETEQIKKERDLLLSESGDLRAREKSLGERVSSLTAREELLQKEREDLQHENKNLREKEKSLRERVSSLTVREELLHKKLESQKKHYEEKIQDRERHFEQLEEKAKTVFENTANKIFQEGTKSYREEASKNLSQLLKPVREDMEGFKKSIQSFESKEVSLDKTLKIFTDINTQMRDGALQLTEALRGDLKTQGQWGEFVLENILEKSGLRKGEEFIVQGQGLNIKDEEGGHVRPDVIVKLPDNRHIVIDSKVSLSCLTPFNSHAEEKDSFLEKLEKSLNAHIDNLSSKKYQFSSALKTPDFVLMFIPAEEAFALAAQIKKDLFQKAWSRSIVIVSPHTLYATLRTIASIWKIERQNRNALKIAKQAGLLYDKFVGFLEDMGKIDSGLKTARDSYDSAFGKLKDGQGNLIQKALRLKELGAGNKKEIPPDFENE